MVDATPALSFGSVVISDFKALRQAGTEGSVPGVHALQNQEELFSREEGIPLSLSIGGELVGVMTFTPTALEGYWTTVTYIRKGHHSPLISATLKNTAHSVCQRQGLRYVVFVQPDNLYAIDSMAKVWPEAKVLRMADGTLGYVPSGGVSEPTSPELAQLLLGTFSNRA